MSARGEIILPDYLNPSPTKVVKTNDDTNNQNTIISNLNLTPKKKTKKKTKKKNITTTNDIYNREDDTQNTESVDPQSEPPDDFDNKLCTELLEKAIEKPNKPQSVIIAINELTKGYDKYRIDRLDLL